MVAPSCGSEPVFAIRKPAVAVFTLTDYVTAGIMSATGFPFLSSTLIAIDVTIAALFWAWGADEDIVQRLVKKTLYIGAFAWIIGNFSILATIIFDSFAALGLQASGSAMDMTEFMKPGTVAATGLDAGAPLLDATEDLVGPVGLFTNFPQICILLFAWAITVLAFFILAIQLFVTIIEFKLVTLAGFVLLPFAFWGRTAFMAERVLGHIISSGIKVLVLAVIIGIGTTLFDQFTSAGVGADPDIKQVMAIALAALTLLALGIFGPGIANGIVTGGPQLGAGAAAGTALMAGASMVGGAAGMRIAGGAAANAMGATAHGAASAAGAAQSAYSLGSAGKTGASAVAGGARSVGQVALSAATSPLRKAAASLKASHRAGARAVAGTSSAASPGASAGAPAWATAMKRRQAAMQGATIASQALRGGDSHGGGTGPDISQKD